MIVTERDMESRRRVAALTSVFTNAMAAMVDKGVSLTLMEVLAALANVQNRVIAEALAEERKP